MDRNDKIEVLDLTGLRTHRFSKWESERIGNALGWAQIQRRLAEERQARAHVLWSAIACTALAVAAVIWAWSL